MTTLTERMRALRERGARYHTLRRKARSGWLRCCRANALVADGRSTDASGMASIVFEFAPL